MGYAVLFTLLALVALLGVASSDKKACIKGKYEQSLGKPFSDCYGRRRDLEIPRMKQCWTDLMKTKNVVKVASDGQMTVDRQKFGEYATQNRHDVGKAMKACHDKKDDRMYNEAARASQCVFEGMKKTCK